MANEYPRVIYHPDGRTAIAYSEFDWPEGFVTVDELRQMQSAPKSRRGRKPRKDVPVSEEDAPSAVFRYDKDVAFDTDI